MPSTASLDKMLNPWARASLDPNWDPSLYEVVQGKQWRHTDSCGKRHGKPSPEVAKEPLVTTMAAIQKPTWLEAMNEAAWQPTWNSTVDTRYAKTSSPFAVSRMPQVRGRLSVMTSALNDKFARELCNIEATKSKIEAVLASDARQLFLRGVLLNDSEMDSNTKLYWMDTRDDWYQQQIDHEPSNSRQSLQVPEANETSQTRLDRTERNDSIEATAEPSSEIDLQNLEAYKPKGEKTLSKHMPLRHLDSPPEPVRGALEHSSTADTNGLTEGNIDPEEQPKQASKGATPSLPAYRTGRRRMLLHTIHRQRRTLSDRLDKTEKELETYGAMRNMEHVWDPAPSFECNELDSLLNAIDIKIAKHKEEHATKVKTYMIEIDNRNQSNAMASGSAPKENPITEPSKSDDMTKYSNMAFCINELRHKARDNETRAQTLAHAIALPTPQRRDGARQEAASTDNDRRDSQASSIATESLWDDSRRPSTATDTSLIEDHQNSTTAGALAAQSTAHSTAQVDQGSAHAGDESRTYAIGLTRLTHAPSASEQATHTHSRDAHQTQSSTNMLASKRSEMSGTSSNLSHMSRIQNANPFLPVNPDVDAENTIPKAQADKAQVAKAQFEPVCPEHPDEETRKLLRFRRELLREWHIWDHIEGCLSKRMDAISRERTRLQRFIAVLRATHVDGSQHRDAATTTPTPSSPAPRTPSMLGSEGPQEVLERQRARARELGFAPGTIVLNPDTPTDAGAYVWIPSMQVEHTPSRVG